jgi:NAD(P)-dependent dehydrogenase (short-subunit alcohol dehydrogenase family)
MTRPLEGRNALITGGSQGLGLAIARAYVEAGANVMICARDVSALPGLPGSVIAQAADVSKPDDVRRVAERALETFSQLHILVNNAGIYGPKGPIEEVAWNEWVHAIEINLLVSVLMCRAVVPHFKEHRYGKIIQLSGGGATAPLPRLSAYAASKAAIVRFAETLAEEVREDNIDVNSIAPGPLNTRLLEEVLAAGPERVGGEFYERAVKQKTDGGAPLERGAGLAVFLGSAVSDGITGKILSAVWDPWETLPQHLDALGKSDVYTLRRILPKDRGLKSG